MFRKAKITEQAAAPTNYEELLFFVIARGVKSIYFYSCDF